MDEPQSELESQDGIDDPVDGDPVDGDPVDDDEYDVVSMPFNWAGLSLLAFALNMAVNLLGWRLQIGLLRMVLLTLGLAPVGFLSALLGLKFGSHKKAARIGLFLNGTVVFIILALAATSIVFRLLRRFG